MITVAEHLKRVLDTVERLPSVLVPVERAAGLVTSKAIRSGVDLPRFDNSAMDGYLGVASELTGIDPENPRSIPVSGTIAAGDEGGQEHVPGTLWRIMTGAPVPSWADAVIPVEDTDGRPREVLVRRSPEAGRHLRRRGEDVQAGQVVLPADTRLGPGQLALVISCGITEVEVTPAVKVAVISTGDELVPLGDRVRPGHIVDSNAAMLVAAVREAGHYGFHAGHVADDEKEVTKAIGQQTEAADLVITTGGVSMGEFDAVKGALSGDSSMWFGQVAMQPGKPQGFGTVGKAHLPVFALPGNPASALVSFEVFVRPALAALSGAVEDREKVTAIVAQGWRSSPDREQYQRVSLSYDVSGGWAARPAGGTGSHLLSGLAHADGLAIIDAEVDEVEVGSEVEVLLWRRPVKLVDAGIGAPPEPKGSGDRDGGRPE